MRLHDFPRHPLTFGPSPVHRLGRLTDTGPGRVLTSPVVGPLLVPAVTAVLVFGPLAGAAVAHPPVEWLTQLGVLVVGCAIALPLVTASSRATCMPPMLTSASPSRRPMTPTTPGRSL